MKGYKQLLEMRGLERSMKSLVEKDVTNIDAQGVTDINRTNMKTKMEWKYPNNLKIKIYKR